MFRASGTNDARAGLRAYAAFVAAGLILASCSGTREPDRAPAARGSYAHKLHTRFYEAWKQPDEVRRTTRRKISVPVDVVIGEGGRVLSFQPRQRSGFPALDESIAAVGTRVRKVPAPPGATGEFKLRIYFVLDVAQ